MDIGFRINLDVRLASGALITLTPEQMQSIYQFVGETILKVPRTPRATTDPTKKVRRNESKWKRYTEEENTFIMNLLREHGGAVPSAPLRRFARETGRTYGSVRVHAYKLREDLKKVAPTQERPQEERRLPVTSLLD